MDKNKYWQDPGILRKKSEDVQELLIFGYASKLFRDDSKAQEIDQGKHLIPWMGDDSLKIDRYDARGHLGDLTPYEPSSNSNYVLSPEERKFEELLNAERYQFLNPNEQENQMYQEEELKRLKQELRSDNAYGQVQYQYQDNPPAQTASDQQEEEEDDEPFVPSPLLDLPTNLVLPKSEKENVRIEKTASHVAAKGVQLEIIIKARQTHNPKFAFMQKTHPLHPYYTFLVAQIKSGRYKPKDKTQEEENAPANEDHYLHPSLASASVPVEAAPSIPSIPYKPSPDCAYLALVQNIKTVQQISQETPDSYATHTQHTPYYSQFEYDHSSWNTKTAQTPAYPSPQPSVSASSVNPYSALVKNIKSVQATEPQPRTLPRKKRFSPDTRNLALVVSDVIIPPDDIKEVIFKVVSFAKSQNPEVVSKLFQSDIQKFGFLQPGHRYHKYYLHHLTHMKVEEDVTYDPANPTNTEVPENTEVLSDEEEPQIRSESMSPASDVSEGLSEKFSKEATLRIPSPPPPPKIIKKKPSSSCKPAPVSFSIKKPKEEKLEVTSALIEESSSGDEESALRAQRAEKQAAQRLAEERATQTAEVKSTETPKVKSSQGKDVKKEKEKTEVSQKKMKEASGVEGAVAGSLTSSLATENVEENTSMSKDESPPLNGVVKAPPPPAPIPEKEPGKKMGRKSKDRHRKRNKSSYDESRKTKESKKRSSATLTSSVTPVSAPASASRGSSQGKETKEDLDKKREERRRRARALVEKLKEKGDVSAMLNQKGLGQLTVEGDAGNPSGKTEDNAAALDEDKDQDQAKVEKELRQKVKNSLSKILTSNVLPPIPEEDSIMSIEDFGLLDRPYLSVSSPADTEDTGRSSIEHFQSKPSSHEGSPARRVPRSKREGSEEARFPLNSLSLSLSFMSRTNNGEESLFNGFQLKNKLNKPGKSNDKSEDESEEEEEEGLEIRPDKQQQRGKDSLSRLLARSQPDESLRKRRHSLTSNSEHDSERPSKHKKSSSRESSLSLDTEKLKISKRMKSRERRSVSKEHSGVFIKKMVDEFVSQNGSHKKHCKKHKKHSNDVTKSKKHHRVHSSNESSADSSDSSTSSTRSSSSVHKKSKKKHKHRKSKKESKKSKKKHRKRKRSTSSTSSS